MKKLLSIILSLIMAMSVLVIPATVSAKETKKVPNTYVANFDSVYNFSKGTISDDFWGPFSYYKKNSNKYVTIENTTPYDSDSTLGYYVRGNEIYYCFVETKYANFVYSIKTFNINNKKKKKFYEVTDKKVSSVRLIGGYGSGVIFVETKKKANNYTYDIKMLRNKKTTKLFSVKAKDYVDFYIFNGKIYYNNKAYNIVNGKKTTFTTKKIYVTNNYMYYINKNNNLKSLDKKNVRRMVAKKVYKYYCSDNKNSVAYSKLDSNGFEVFYQRNGTGKQYKLCTWKDILKASNIKNSTLKRSDELSSGLFYKNKVYFNTHFAILNVNAKGGTPKLVVKATDENITDMYIFGDKIICSQYNPDDYIVDD